MKKITLLLALATFMLCFNISAQLPIGVFQNFETITSPTEVFVSGNAALYLRDNPSLSGINTSNKCISVDASGSGMMQISFTNSVKTPQLGAIPSDATHFRFKYFINANNQTRLIEFRPESELNWGGTQLVTINTDWQYITFDLEKAKQNNTTFFYFRLNRNADNTAAGGTNTIYIDDFEFLNGLTTSAETSLEGNDELVALEYYTLQGLKVELPLTPGIYVQKKTYASQKTEVVKIMINKKHGL